MRKILLLAALLAGSPVAAQTAPPANVQMQNGMPRAVTPVAIVDSTGASVSPATRTTAAGTSDTQAVPVQGVTGGVPQNVVVQSSVLPTGAATQTTLAAVAASVAGPTPAGTATIGNVLRSTYWNESTTPPAASGQVIGTTRDSGVAGAAVVANTFACAVFANQAGGTLELRGSSDGSTYITWLTTAVAASTGTVLTERVHTRYHGCRYTAGSTAPTVFALDSQLGE